MKYETAIELFAEGKIGYQEAKEELEECFREKVEECPWDNIKEEAKKWVRAKGLLEELRFNRMYEE